MGLARTLFDCDKDDSQSILSGGLKNLYDGDLRFGTQPVGRPYVIANFVSTLDGVASYQIESRSGGSAISGSNPTDRFIMGLLRASADAIIVGAATAQDVSAKSVWTPESVYPDAKQLYADFRLNTLHKSEYPLLVIVSGSGRLELERAIFHTPAMRALVITTAAGEDELERRGAAALSSVEVRALESSGAGIDPPAILQLLESQFGVKTLLHEGGPKLLGRFLAAGVMNELFLTLSPQIAGRSACAMRPGIVQGAAFSPESSPRFQTVSVKQDGAFLYLRYRRD